ncbi:unnamed protein product [Acanthocheilonema viteae]|uniref:Uncharacterized protein n=1 Tax=Acanthocheilonema viteae TaxID=6277 RepID=A0A498S7Q9_ACAVI|nr:unnamed protein product [Acanthocheilonema viteae]
MHSYRNRVHNLCTFICCACKNICGSSENSRNVLASGRNEIDGPSSYTHSYFQNSQSYKIPSNNFNTIPYTIDERDTLVPMVPLLPNDEKKNIDHESIKAHNPQSSLPAPVNQYAIDRIMQENNLQKSTFERPTGELDTIGEISTIPIPYTTIAAATTTAIANFDYDDSKNYLSTNQINAKKNTGKIDNSGECDNPCDELPDYSSNFSGTQPETTSPADYDEFGKSEQEEKKDYYDEVEDERNIPIAFSSYPTLKKQSMDIIPKKSCQFCNNSNLKEAKLLHYNVQEQLASIPMKQNYQKANILKSKSGLNISANNIFKLLNNANSSNVGIEGQKNLAQLQPHEQSTATNSYEKFAHRLTNYNSLFQINSPIKELNATGQSNVSQFSSLTSTKKPNNKSANFSIKSFKLINVKALKNTSANEQLNIPSNDNWKQNLSLKSFVKQRNISAQINNELSKLQRIIRNNGVLTTTATATTTTTANNLQFWNIRKKPKQTKFINGFSYHKQKKPKIIDMRNKFRNAPILQMQRHIWPNMIITEKERKKLTKPPPTLITTTTTTTTIPLSVINNTLSPLNSSIEQQQILIRKIKTKRPIRARRVKIFDVNIFKSDKMPSLLDLY